MANILAHLYWQVTKTVNEVDERARAARVAAEDPGVGALGYLLDTVPSIRSYIFTT